MIWEALLVIGVVLAIGLTCYACCVASSNSHRDSTEEFELYLKEKEERKHLKNGRHNDV